MGEEKKSGKVEYHFWPLHTCACLPSEDNHPLSVLVWPHNSFLGVISTSKRGLSTFPGEYFVFLLNTSSKKLCIWGEYKGVRLIAFPMVILLFLWKLTLQKQLLQLLVWVIQVLRGNLDAGAVGCIDSKAAGKGWALLWLDLMVLSTALESLGSWEVLWKRKEVLGGFLVLISDLSISISTNSSGKQGK